MTSRSRTTQAKEIDSAVYDNKVRINHWHDTMMEHKKIYYAAELKMYQLELALAKWDNANKLRWSVRHREFSNLLHREPPPEKPKRRTPEPAYGYVPLTRTLTPAHRQDKDNKDEQEEASGTAAVVEKDALPVHSEGYKPFSNTASIHSYMYHLRQIYGK